MTETGSQLKFLAFATILAFLLAGCASGDGGQVLSGVLMGIGQGLSGL